MDKWTIPRTDLDPRGHHVVPPTAARPEPNFQPNTPTPAQDTNATVPNCSCQRCSDAQRRQQTWIEQRDPQHFSNAVTPYVNRDRGVNHVGTALIAPVRSQAQFAPPQAAEIQDNFGYPPVLERAGPFDVGSVPAPILNASIRGGSQASSGPLHQQPRCIRQYDPLGARPVCFLLMKTRVLSFVRVPQSRYMARKRTKTPERIHAWPTSGLGASRSSVIDVERSKREGGKISQVSKETSGSRDDKYLMVAYWWHWSIMANAASCRELRSRGLISFSPSFSYKVPVRIDPLEIHSNARHKKHGKKLVIALSYCSVVQRREPGPSAWIHERLVQGVQTAPSGAQPPISRISNSSTVQMPRLRPSGAANGNSAQEKGTPSGAQPAMNGKRQLVSRRVDYTVQSARQVVDRGGVWRGAGDGTEARTTNRKKAAAVQRGKIRFRIQHRCARRVGLRDWGALERLAQRRSRENFADEGHEARGGGGKTVSLLGLFLLGLGRRVHGGPTGREWHKGRTSDVGGTAGLVGTISGHAWTMITQFGTRSCP
ncbi:hypothetical protein EDB84DRAFT_1679259 [Lactarius hengduanensis]|nr:hypothetical protein EDB84DRAFT_1679259 [Lactarius hengduanensis]